MDKLYAGSDSQLVIFQPEFSDWKCECFGMGSSLVITPFKGHVPNWFWRWMQYLIFGNKWRKKR